MQNFNRDYHLAGVSTLNIEYNCILPGVAAYHFWLYVFVCIHVWVWDESLRFTCTELVPRPISSCTPIQVGSIMALFT